MKKILILAILSFTLLLLGCHANDEPAWREAYAELLREYSIKFASSYDFMGDGLFMLVDIDQSGVPNLIVADSFHFTSYLAGFSFEGGELSQLQIDFFHDYSAPVLLPLDGSAGIVQIFGEAWIGKISKFVLEDNRLREVKRVSSFYWWEADDEEDAWYVDDLAVTQAEHDAALLEFFGFNWEDVRNWEFGLEFVSNHMINEYNIQNIVLDGGN